MIIAVNYSNFIAPGYSNFFDEYLIQFAADKPDHQFIFITATATAAQSDFSKNITWVVSSPKAGNALMWKLWLNYTLPAIARKHKAGLLIHTGGVCSVRTQLPQLLCISDLSFLSFPHYYSKSQRRFLKNNMQAFLSKAVQLVTGSAFIVKELADRYLIETGKVSIVHPHINKLYQPIGWQAKEAMKEQFAEGKEYFLFSGEIHPRYNLINLLKAFSFFKKRQKSNMQLLMIVKNTTAGNAFIESLKTYKYRDDVKLLTDLPAADEAKITAAAYAFIYPTQYDCTGLHIMQAMHCGVPVITSKTGALPGIAADAALYINLDSFEDIADKMMRVFKDENKRNELVRLGLKRMESFANERGYDWWDLFVAGKKSPRSIAGS